MRISLPAFGLLLLAPMITACTMTVRVKDTAFPTPAIDPIPAKVAVVYGEEFRTYEHVGPVIRDSTGADISYGNDLRYKLGRNNVNLFDQLTESMFKQSKSYNSWEALEATGEEFDAILEPIIEHFDSWQGEDGGVTVPGFFLNVTYGIKLHGPQRQEILNWSLESHQVFCERIIFCGPSTKTDIVEAGMRDIAAQFYMKFPNLPEVVNWTANLKADQ